MHLQMVGSQLIDETALANIGNANNQQRAVWSLCSMPPSKFLFTNSKFYFLNLKFNLWNPKWGLKGDLSSAPTSLETVGMMAAVCGQ